MISLNSGNFNTDVNEYNKFISTLEVCTIKCPHCKHASLIRHAYYSRYINISGEKIILNILRVKCKICGKTHAILPCFVVPYLHEPIIDLQNIVIIGYNEENIEHSRSIRKIRAKWNPILRTHDLKFNMKLIDICSKISQFLKQCFMQLHKGFYHLATINHTT